jgi:hypothetical protein
MLQDDIVGLKLLALELLRVSRGGEGDFSGLTSPSNERWHFFQAGIPLGQERPVEVLCGAGVWLEVRIALAD